MIFPALAGNLRAPQVMAGQTVVTDCGKTKKD
jgi:hypothetical protein